MADGAARGVKPGRRSAAELVQLVTDSDSFRAWDADVVSADPLEFSNTRSYRERLREASAHSGASEAVTTGRAQIRGHQLVIIAAEFDFLAGTMGLAAGERIARAFERARTLNLPVVGMPASGGTRMQEGTLAFMQMVKVAAAVHAFREQGGRYLVYLRHPTTGGVLASWGSLAQVTWAEPGALIGLTGPRVIELLTGEPVDEGLQVAEHLHARGIVDDVVAPEDLAEHIRRVLSVMDDQPLPRTAGDLRSDIWGVSHDAWESVQRSRDPDRPGLRQLLNVLAEDMTLLCGDGAGDEDPGSVLALARIAGIPAMVIGQDRPPGARGASIGAVGYRKAVRGMILAEELGLPVMTVVDTQGVTLSQEAEESGLARQIARCTATLTSLKTPTVAVLMGEGSGGGALSHLAADRVICAQHGWLAPIAPEGASAILHRDITHAADLAARQGTHSAALLRDGVVDVVVAERDASFLTDMGAVIATELQRVVSQEPNTRLRRRAERHRNLGRGGYLGG